MAMNATIFAPTDAAFREAFQILNLSAGDVLNNTVSLANCRNAVGDGQPLTRGRIRTGHVLSGGLCARHEAGLWLGIVASCGLCQTHPLWSPKISVSGSVLCWQSAG
jgi:hypothetical protein